MSETYRSAGSLHWRSAHLGSTPFFFSNERDHPRKQPLTMSVFNDLGWKRNASRLAIRGNNFHMKPGRLRDPGEQNHSFPEALISMNATGNFADTFFICVCVQGALRMPASQCHFEGKDKNFLGVQPLTLRPSALPPVESAFSSGSILTQSRLVVRGPLQPGFRSMWSCHPEPSGKEPPRPPRCHLPLGCAILQEKRKRRPIARNSQRLSESLLQGRVEVTHFALGHIHGAPARSRCRRPCES